MSSFCYCQCFREALLLDTGKIQKEDDLLIARDRTMDIIKRGKLPEDKCVKFMMMADQAYKSLIRPNGGLFRIVKHDCVEYDDLIVFVSKSAGRVYGDSNLSQQDSSTSDIIDKSYSTSNQTIKINSLPISNQREMFKIQGHEYKRREVIFTFIWLNPIEQKKGNLKLAKKYPEKLQLYLNNLEIDNSRRYKNLMIKYPELENF